MMGITTTIYDGMNKWHTQMSMKEIIIILFWGGGCRLA